MWEASRLGCRDAGMLRTMGVSNCKCSAVARWVTFWENRLGGVCSRIEKPR
jgi:hypothetical protein